MSQFLIRRRFWGEVKNDECFEYLGFGDNSRKQELCKPNANDGLRFSSIFLENTRQEVNNQVFLGLKNDQDP